MKALLLLCTGLLTVVAVAQNSTDSTPGAPTPVIITPGQPPTGTGVGLQELSPPMRDGRRGGVYVTGAPPMPPMPQTYDFSYRIANAITNALRTNEVGATAPAVGTNEMGATGSAAVTNTGSGTSYDMGTEMPPPPPLIPPPFVPLNRPPRLTPSTPNGSTAPSTTRNNTVFPPLSAPAGTTTPAIPPAGTTSPVTPPPGPGASLPGSQIVTPPPPISTPPPISGPQR